MAHGIELRRAPPPRRRASPSLRAYLRTRTDPLTSLVLVMPIFVVYHVGLLFVSVRNGVDLVSHLALTLLDSSVGAYLGVTAAFVAAIAVAYGVLRRHGRAQPATFTFVLGESAVLAAVMAVVVGATTLRLFSGNSGNAPFGVLDKLVIACGAGFHEELVFRVVGFAGLAAVLAKVRGVKPWHAATLALLLSSLLFSAVHYVGPFGDAFSAVSFTFRALVGAFLAAVHRWRGFAVAVYTHTLYDLFVFFIVQ